MHPRYMCTLSAFMCLQGVTCAQGIVSKSLQLYSSVQSSQACPEYITRVRVLEKFVREKGYSGHGITFIFLLPVF